MLNENSKIIWCVYWYDKNQKCHSIEVTKSDNINNVYKALQYGVELLKKQGCKIKKEYEADIKILSIDNVVKEHTAEF